MNSARGILFGFSMLALSACGGASDDAGENVSPPPESAETAAGISGTQIAQPSQMIPGIEDAEPALAPEDYAIDPGTDFLGLKLPFIAIGEEPYWRADFDGAWIIFDRQGLPEVDAPITMPVAGDGGSLVMASPPMSVYFNPKACESDENSISVTVTFEEIEYQGCGFNDVPDAKGGDASKWADLIPNALMAIDGCLADAKTPRLIHALYPREDDLMGMVFSDSEGRLEECGASKTSGNVSFRDPIEIGQEASWMKSEARFARQGKSPNCVGNGEVIELAGDPLGEFFEAGCSVKEL